MLRGRVLLLEREFDRTFVLFFCITLVSVYLGGDKTSGHTRSDQKPEGDRYNRFECIGCESYIIEGGGPS